MKSDIIQNMFEMLWAVELGTNNKLYKLANNYINKYLSDKWESIEGKLRVRKRKLNKDVALKYIAYKTLGPLLVEGYDTYEHIRGEREKAQLKEEADRLTENRETFKVERDIRDLIVQSYVIKLFELSLNYPFRYYELSIDLLRSLRSLDDSDSLHASYLTGLVLSKMPYDPPECTTAAINLLNEANRKKQQRGRYWIPYFTPVLFPHKILPFSWWMEIEENLLYTLYS